MFRIILFCTLNAALKAYHRPRKPKSGASGFFAFSSKALRMSSTRVPSSGTARSSVLVIQLGWVERALGVLRAGRRRAGSCQAAAVASSARERVRAMAAWRIDDDRRSTRGGGG